uniref:Uncharacterized protein LOC102807588 n=1 Tax=Saccoglossus kowalevskii TaxID=10224 RepID=A0ABM0MS46_SACKO|nr:PREDICTED: uncharacterized protein LOC102807588 [Saccoglossus kowalevskii]
MDAGRVLAVLFFLALSFAGLSSLAANVELVSKTLVDFGLNRKFAVLIVVIFVFCVGCLNATYMDFLINQDFVWGFALIISGLVFQYLVIRYGTTQFRSKLINDYSTDDWYLPKIWEWIVKYLAPVEALFLILWFAINGITDNSASWYTFGRETLMSCLVQWLGLILILNVINTVYVFWYLPRRTPYDVLDLPESDAKPTKCARPANPEDFMETKH